jgi:AraC-like DNA-binding protein
MQRSTPTRFRAIHDARPIAGLPWVVGVFRWNDQAQPMPSPAVDPATDQVLLVSTGELVLEHGERRLPLVAGQAVALRVGDPAWRLRTGGPAWTVLGVRLDGYAEAFADLRARHPEPFRCPADGALAQQLAALVDEDAAPMRIGLAAGLRLASGVVALLAEQTVAGEADSQAAGRLVRQALRLIEARPPVEVHVEGIAAALGISRRHLTRCFQQRLGRSPAQVITEHLVRQACTLLRSTTAPVAEVAHRLGYQSPSAFAAAFRDLTGLSPTEYRDEGSATLW